MYFLLRLDLLQLSCKKAAGTETVMLLTQTPGGTCLLVLNLRACPDAYVFRNRADHWPGLKSRPSRPEAGRLGPEILDKF